MTLQEAKKIARSYGYRIQEETLEGLDMGIDTKESPYKVIQKGPDKPIYVLISRSPEFSDFLKNFFLPQVSDGWWENNNSQPVHDLWAKSRIVEIVDLKDPRVPRGAFPGVMLSLWRGGAFLGYNGNNEQFPEEGPGYAVDQMENPPDKELIRKMCSGVLRMVYKPRPPKTPDEEALFL